MLHSSGGQGALEFSMWLNLSTLLYDRTITTNQPPMTSLLFLIFDVGGQLSARTRHTERPDVQGHLSAQELVQVTYEMRLGGATSMPHHMNSLQVIILPE